MIASSGFGKDFIEAGLADDFFALPTDTVFPTRQIKPINITESAAGRIIERFYAAGGLDFSQQLISPALSRLSFITSKALSTITAFMLCSGNFKQQEILMSIDAGAAETLHTLHSVPDDARDDDWYVTLFDTLPEARYVLSSPEPVKAPDGFYYFNVSLLPEKGLPKSAKVVSLDDILDDCLERCAGIVIYPDLPCRQDPVWILSYGELHSFSAFDNFSGDPQDLEEIMDAEENGSADHDDETEPTFSKPDDDFIHPGARRFLKNFFDALDLEGVQITVIKDASQTPSRALALNLDEDDFRSSEELENALETVSWLLPPHRAMVLGGSIVPMDEFSPLV